MKISVKNNHIVMVKAHTAETAEALVDDIVCSHLLGQRDIEYHTVGVVSSDYSDEPHVIRNHEFWEYGDDPTFAVLTAHIVKHLKQEKARLLKKANSVIDGRAFEMFLNHSETLRNQSKNYDAVIKCLEFSKELSKLSVVIDYITVGIDSVFSQQFHRCGITNYVDKGPGDVWAVIVNVEYGGN